jgi:hypothetical protein
MKKRDNLASNLERDIRRREYNGCDALRGSTGMRGADPRNGIGPEFSPERAIPLLDATWVLLGVTGYHP